MRADGDGGDDDEARADGPPVPGQVHAAVVIVWIEAAALVGAAGVLVDKTITGHPNEVGRALFGALLAVAGAAALVVAGRALMRLTASARTPVVVLQLLALPVSYSLAFQAHRVEYGGPILVAALAVLFLLFTPPAREALDRSRN